MAPSLTLKSTDLLIPCDLLKKDGFSENLVPQCEAPKIAKLVYNSNNYGLWYL